MVILILIAYILIGVCIAIGYCVIEYKDYKNSNIKNWDIYYIKEDLTEWSMGIILSWPLISIFAISYVLSQIPRIVIKKYLDD